MKRQLPRSLGPKAKRLVIRETPGEVAYCLVELAPNADSGTVTTKLGELNAEIRTWNKTSRLLTVRIPAANLPKLAELDQVVYAEIAERYTP